MKVNIILGKIGKCIYCGSKKDLRDEHVIPHALTPKGMENTFVLEDATCGDCADITSNFERVQKDSFEIPRSSFNLKSYKRRLPKEFPIDIITNGEHNKVYIHINEFSSLWLPIYDIPSYLHGRSVNDLMIKGIVLYQMGGIPLEYLGKKYNTNEISLTSTWHSHDFPKMLAKIAYGFSIAKHGIDNIEDVYILPAILGEKDDIGRWVGCATNICIEKGPLHIIKEYVVNGEIMVVIKLFALHESLPEYIVIVGKLKDRSSI